MLRRAAASADPIHGVVRPRGHEDRGGEVARLRADVAHEQRPAEANRRGAGAEAAPAVT